MVKRVHGQGWFADVPYGMDAKWDAWLDAHHSHLALIRSEMEEEEEAVVVVKYTPDAVVLWQDSDTVVCSCGGLLVGWRKDQQGSDTKEEALHWGENLALCVVPR